QETGEFYLVEVNPRFPSWIHLAVAAGQNLPWAAVRLALGEEVKPFAGYQVGLMSLRVSMDVTCPLAVYESLVTTGEVDHRNLSQDLIKPQWRSWQTDASLSQQIAERRRKPPQSQPTERSAERSSPARLFEEQTR
ncbi:MAG: ATP-grasp domain-containing protein, partial [Acidobacteria bacterium]|nr:ATP-grasp domain-containing protein [Acidobacteriota bacterium]